MRGEETPQQLIITPHADSGLWKHYTPDASRLSTFGEKWGNEQLPVTLLSSVRRLEALMDIAGLYIRVVAQCNFR